MPGRPIRQRRIVKLSRAGILLSSVHADAGRREILNGSKFLIGDFINAVISFILIAAAVYFFIVLPMNCFSLECGAERRPPIRRPRNAPSASAKYLSRHDAALSAPPRSPKRRRAEGHCFAHIYLYLDRFRLWAQRPSRIRNSRFASDLFGCAAKTREEAGLAGGAASRQIDAQRDCRSRFGELNRGMAKRSADLGLRASVSAGRSCKRPRYRPAPRVTSASSCCRAGRSIVAPENPPSSYRAGRHTQPSCRWLSMKASQLRAAPAAN